jgi:hypothetical protein
MALGANDKTGPCLELSCAYDDFYIDYWFDDSSFIAMELVIGVNSVSLGSLIFSAPESGVSLKNWMLVSCG